MEQAEEQSRSLAPGERLGRYVIRKPLGAGGMGEVYLAHDPELDRPVALKLLKEGGPGSGSGSSEGRARLLREAQALARLSHPNVIAVYDVGTTGHQVFIAMEYLQGPTLKAWLQEQPRSWQEVVHLFLQAGQGLAAAHAAGLVHRDFNPGNVLVGADGRVRVLDFGLARTAGGSLEPLAQRLEALQATSPSVLESPLTQEGALVGTPGYLSPEQLQGEPAEAHSDQFSYCVALYEALYGQRPFPARTLPEYVKQVLSGPVPQPPRGSPVPAWLQAIVLRGLAREPSQRFPSMEELLHALGADPLTTRRRWLMASVAVVVLLSLAAVAGLLHRPPNPCEGAEQKLAGVWDEPQRHALQQAFLATRKPFAERSWQGTAQELDRYTQAWVAQHTQACEATRVRHQQPEELMLRRMLCLEQRLHDVRALVGVLTQADEEVVAQAAQSARALPALDTCSNPQSLRAHQPLPEKLQGGLARVQALYNAGRYAQAIQEAEPLAQEAEAAGQEALIADLRRQIYRSYVQLHESEPAEREAHLAAAAAVASAQPDKAARAWFHVALLAMKLRRNSKEVELWLRYGHKAMAQAGNPPDVRAEAERQIAQIHLLNGASALALEHARTALALEEELHGPESEPVTLALTVLASTHSWMGQPQQGLPLVRRALAITEKLQGPEHPSTARNLEQLSALLLMCGQPEEALALQQRAVVLHERLLGPSSSRLASSVINLGHHYLLLGDLAEANRLGERALAIARQSAAPEGWPSLYARALLARTHLLQGHLPQALELSREALAAAERLGGPQSHHLPYLLTLVGQVHLELGHPRQAAELTERSLKIQQGSGLNLPHEVGRTRLVLAQALWELKGSRPRILELLAQARRDFERAGPLARRDQQAWEAWVSARGLQVPPVAPGPPAPAR